jgi:hypothetical protein
MRKPSPVAEIRTHLLRAGFSRKHATRTARELQEHWDELVDEGVRLGLSEADAQREATLRLGSPETLATEFSTRLQQSTFLGRHPIFSFGMLALTLTTLWWVGLGSAVAQACGLFNFDPKIHGNVEPRLQMLDLGLGWVRATSYLVVPWLCCFIAERYFAGWRAALWACLIIAIHNATHFLNVTTTPGHGTVAWGYTLSIGSMPALLPIIASLAVFLLYRAWSLRKQNDSEPSDLTFC